MKKAVVGKLRMQKSDDKMRTRTRRRGWQAATARLADHDSEPTKPAAPSSASSSSLFVAHSDGVDPGMAGEDIDIAL